MIVWKFGLVPAGLLGLLGFGVYYLIWVLIVVIVGFRFCDVCCFLRLLYLICGFGFDVIYCFDCSYTVSSVTTYWLIFAWYLLVVDLLFCCLRICLFD